MFYILGNILDYFFIAHFYILCIFANSCLFFKFANFGRINSVQVFYRSLGNDQSPAIIKISINRYFHEIICMLGRKLGDWNQFNN